MLCYKKWPLLRPLLLYARFLEVVVNCLLKRVKRARNKKLLGNNLWINYNRASYKSVVPRSKDRGCTSAFRGNARGLARCVFVNSLASRIGEGF